jgi:hypothetical protein
MYPNKKEYKKEDLNDDGQCLICWDKKNVYKMHSFVLVTNTCKCNSKIHGSCLFNWIYQTQSCPICRKPSHFNIKLLKYFLKNKHQSLEQGEPFNQNLNLIIKNPLYAIYKVSLCLLQFVAYIFLYSIIYGLILSIRREVEMIN